MCQCFFIVMGAKLPLLHNLHVSNITVCVEILGVYGLLSSAKFVHFL